MRRMVGAAIVGPISAAPPVWGWLVDAGHRDLDGLARRLRGSSFRLHGRGGRPPAKRSIDYLPDPLAFLVLGVRLPTRSTSALDQPRPPRTPAARREHGPFQLERRRSCARTGLEDDRTTESIGDTTLIDALGTASAALRTRWQFAKPPGRTHCRRETRAVGRVPRIPRRGADRASRPRRTARSALHSVARYCGIARKLSRFCNHLRLRRSVDRRDAQSAPRGRPSGSSTGGPLFEDRIAQKLVESSLISQDQLARALESQQSSGGTLSYNLVRRAHLRDGVRRVHGPGLYVPAVDLDAVLVDPDAVDLIPADVATKFQWIPSSARAAHSPSPWRTPTTSSRIDDIKFVAGFDVRPVVATDTPSKRCIDRVTGRPARHHHGRDRGRL